MADKASEKASPVREATLAELPVGTKATIVKVMPKAKGRKKLADVGLIPGSELLIEAHAPFGAGSLRETSIQDRLQGQCLQDKGRYWWERCDLRFVMRGQPTYYRGAKSYFFW